MEQNTPIMDGKLIIMCCFGIEQSLIQNFISFSSPNFNLPLQYAIMHTCVNL